MESVAKKMIQYKIEFIPFKLKFSHASFERDKSETLWAMVEKDQIQGFGESCPRSYVTGENAETIKKFYEHSEIIKINDCSTLQSFQTWIFSNRVLINNNQSAFCALELAWLDWFGLKNKKSLEDTISTKKKSNNINPTMVIGLKSVTKMIKNLIIAKLFGINDIKLKISSSIDDQTRVQAFLNHPITRLFHMSGVRFRMDANNSFISYEELLSFLQNIIIPIWGIEEPFATVNKESISKFLKLSKSFLILDESLTKLSDLDFYDDFPSRVCLNIRISKLGGINRTIEIIDQAQKCKMLWGIGSQVGETSLLTRAAMAIISKYNGKNVFYEGGFSDHLLSIDPILPKLSLSPFIGIKNQNKIGPHGLGILFKTENPFIKKVSL
jgi:L-alanine-DL-glutamate epimerase-like enolase superfamily enzyme